jgi:hypothetical protein
MDGTSPIDAHLPRVVPALDRAQLVIHLAKPLDP